MAKFSGIGLSLFSSNVTIKVTPEQLTEKSSEVAGKVQSMRQHFKDLQDAVNKSKSYWVGEAGDKHRQMYADLEEEIEEILNRLAEHPRDLVTIAQKYSDVELKIQQEIEALPSDILI
ncbi:MAG: WXG100 family type VII secretion target [Lachnospiraceae bacterium]|nr:WXG100 family type VII secretion target [Lachnospiraceae bacterium]